MAIAPLTWLFLCVLAAAAPARQAAAAPHFKHVIIVFQENRTPDNLFGSNPKFEPGVDIASSGVNSRGKTVPLGPVQLSACYDIGHSHAAFETALTQGFDQEQAGGKHKCTVPAKPQFKFVDNSVGTVQPYFDIASAYGFANRMFQTNQGPSFPAHQFIFGGTSQPSAESPLFAAENPANVNKNAGCPQAGQKVVLINPEGVEALHGSACFEHPTLTDLLNAARPPVTWRYYAPTAGSIWTAPNAIQHICQAGHGACQGQDWRNGNIVAANPAQILSDIAACHLQAVNWVIPTAEESDHASINTGLGPQWVASIVNAVGRQAACAGGDTYWNDTAILIAWDDWGGWFDHVKPFTINKQNAEAQWGAGYTYGFRVPLLVVSAYTPAGFVDNTDLDFGNILYFIERNFGLGFIGGKTTNTYGQYADYHAAPRGDLSEFFGLTSPRRFQPITAKLGAKDFLAAPVSSLPPDDD